MKQTNEIFYRNVGAWLRNQRQLKKKTQTEIAEVIGVTFQQIQKYEKSVNKLIKKRMLAFIHYLFRFGNKFVFFIQN